MPKIELESYLPQTASAVTQTVSSGINWGVTKLGSILNTYLPSSVTNTAVNIMDSAAEKLEETKEHALRSAMTAARGGKIPSYDIARISAVVDELTFEGDYIYNILSKILIILFVLVLVFLLIYSFSWFDAKATKTKITKAIGKPPQQFRFHDRPTPKLKNTRKILKHFLEME